MDWIKQNKFLAVFLAITLVVAGVLGFLTFSAKTAFEEKQLAYTDKVNELGSLQSGTPYPDEENFKKMQELQKAHQAAIDDLHKQLTATELPLTPLTPERF